jgi:hypothetical protein
MKRRFIPGAVALVVGLLWLAYKAASAVGGGEMPWQGWLALVAGVVATAGLGGGLMALVFYSSRQGYDDRVYHETDRTGDVPKE